MKKKYKIIKIRKKVGETPCDRYCSYWSGSPGEHDCGKPIYGTRYKCGYCDRISSSEQAIKIHQTIKHKKKTQLKEEVR